MRGNIFPGLAFVFVVCIFSSVVCGQKARTFGGQTSDFTEAESKNLTSNSSIQARNEDVNSNNPAAGVSAFEIQSFSNPLILNQANGCAAENLNSAKFSPTLDAKTRLSFCEAVQKVAAKLKQNWSPELRDEIFQIWQIFEREKVVIRPMKKDISSRIVAAAEAFTDDEQGAGFNASFYLRPERADDKSFFLVFMHEMRHVYDFYALWKNHTNITEAELEMRGFRIMGKIYQELPEKPYFFRMPTFWEDDWKNLSAAEIESKREEKIEKFMRGNGFYKSLMKNAAQHTVGYLATSSDGQISPETKENKGEKLPVRLKIDQTKAELPQQVKELSFALARTSDPKNSDELLRAALVNEKNLYYKMNNFVYEQNLQLQCWKNEKVTENYLLDNRVARTENGETSIQNENPSSVPAKLPTCVLNMDLIKSDAAETFWSAPYLETMQIKFDAYAEIAGVKVAKYTVYQPTTEKFNEMAAQYPRIKNFRAFVGTIFVSVGDAQIIKFWGTSFSGADVTGYQSQKAFGSYCATAIRQKLSSGVWVTSLLNTVAVTTQKDKIKPFSYTVKYQNYRQSATGVKILDDEETAMK